MSIEGFAARGDQLYVHAYGKEAPIQLMGARLSSAAMRDDWTEELIAWLPEYRRHGANAAVIFWQGSSGGWTNPTREMFGKRPEPWTGNAASFCLRDGRHVYEPDPARQCHQAAFHLERDYAVDERIGRRIRAIIEAMGALDMVTVVGVFYFRVFEQMSEENKARYDFRRAARRAAEYLRGQRNILWYPYNEYHSHGERHYGPAMTTEAPIAAEIKAVDPSWLVGGAGEGLDVTMTDSHDYLFDQPCERPLLNVETYGLGAGGNDRFSGRCERVGIWGDEGYGAPTRQDSPATKNDFFREMEGALARPSYHLFGHFQGWHQGAYPLNWARNFMGMTPGLPGGPALHAFNFYGQASPHYAEAVLVDDDNQGRGCWGSRGTHWYWEAVRERYSKVKHPYFDSGAWDLKRLVEAVGV